MVGREREEERKIERGERETVAERERVCSSQEKKEK